MKFFEKYFGIDMAGRDKVKVTCPFHNDTVASAIINTHENSFHCFACREHYTEQQFVAKINGIDTFEASKLLSKLEDQYDDWELVEKAELWANSSFLERVRSLGLSDETIDNLNLGLVKDDNNNAFLGFPVYINGVLMDIGRYNLLRIKGQSKMIQNKGSETGLIVPFDTWIKDKSKTYLFEGQKDMAIAREHGLNAITFTGGAGAKPNDLIKGAFKGRDVVVVYDNDDAGRSGAKNVYKHLKDVAKNVKYIDISTVVDGKGEDFYDAITKYKMDIFDFLTLEECVFDDEEELDDILVSVSSALKSNQIRTRLKSLVTISADFADTYAVPISIKFRKETNDNGATLVSGEERTWYLNKGNLKQILSLIEVSAKESDILKKIQAWVGIPQKEKHISKSISGYQTIYKVRIVDSNSKVVIASEEEYSNLTLDLYSLDSLKVGGQYMVNYIIYPHPTKNQKLVAIAVGVVEMNAMEMFRIKRDLLKPFTEMGETVKEKVDYLYNSAKHYIAKHLNKELWLFSDLVFNSVLEFDYTDRIRGALDVFILGDTQVGKSETTSKLTELYNFGHFLSLKNATTIGLIGGSHKVDNSMLNTIGAIPRQHRKLVVLEEFSGAPPEFIKTMTDIRSSGQIRITRVAGELRVPCRLRSITISNPVNDEQGNPRYLSSFPNGIVPIMELVKSAEDVVRYDGFMLVPKVSNRFNPFKVALTGAIIPKTSYEHKMQWVYTRKPDNVVMSDEIKGYIWEKAEELNKEFESNFPLFGTTAPLKLARFCVALASLVFNVDETYEKIIVTEEIVDFVVDFLRHIYDNEVFKLREYREEHDMYSTPTKEEIERLQKMYAKNGVLLEFLNTVTSTNTMTLRHTSGLDGDKFNPVFSSLVKDKFIKLSGQSVTPTLKFRKGLKKIDKSFRVDTGSIGGDLTFKIGGSENS